MSGYLIRDKMRKELTNLDQTLKHLYDRAENSFAFFEEVEKLKSKQFLVEHLLSEVNTGESLDEKFVSRELDISILDLKESVDRLKQKFGSRILTFDSFRLLSKN